ncbi:MAG: HPr kinase/phosphatase C-terminal domain-containing protein [Pseudomonadota bacterium]
MPDQKNLHGTCLAVGTRGILLTGPSGSGKSDLALRLIDQPGRGTGGDLVTTRLVADDQVMVRRSGERLLASAPPALKGLLEVRGLGLLSSPALEEVVLRLAFRLVPGGAPERMPGPDFEHLEVLGLFLPILEIDPFQASAPAKVRSAAALSQTLISKKE